MVLSHPQLQLFVTIKTGLVVIPPQIRSLCRKRGSNKGLVTSSSKTSTIDRLLLLSSSQSLHIFRFLVLNPIYIMIF
ncbi:hypothetical protein L6452_24721 [Arctium lappa]|uniref:Uncharacterized protein n=1 Tax=Arctium lappa TaxID=4217 RepID=A0ACB9AE86_ARCLA|nr:hypothetical protein L6452_24721 [Arctium lappa]